MALVFFLISAAEHAALYRSTGAAFRIAKAFSYWVSAALNLPAS